MDSFTIDEIKSAVKGEILQLGIGKAVHGVSIDSRKVTEHDLYIPIIGEKLDGHQFILNAVEHGATAILTMKREIDAPKDISVIYVNDTVKAIQDLARYHRLRYDIPVVAVTGSSGKTTTKDVIASVLSQKYVTMKTQGNYNNYLGVPQTILQLDDQFEAAVVETGMGRMGEIAETIDEIMPHYVVITNIGTAHLEFLKTRDNILKAKTEALLTLSKDDIAILNGDDPYLNKISNQVFTIKRIGIDAEEQSLALKAKKIFTDAKGVHFSVSGEEYCFRFPGKHNVYNCMAAILIGKDLGMTAEEIQKGFDAFVPSGNRMKIDIINEITYIDDSYNANPDAMRAAVNTMMEMGKDAGKRIVVLGDMLEMGENALELHREVGMYLNEKADVLIAVGPLSEAYIAGAETASNTIQCYHCQDAFSAEEKLRAVAEPKDIVLIKASNGIGLNAIMKKIKGE